MSHRRIRHVNPRDLGGSLVLDSRYIRGVANGGTIQSWPDRSVNNYSVQQSNAGLRPVFTVNGVGGNPTVTFSGTSFTLPSIASTVGTAILVANRTGRANLFNVMLVTSNGTSSFAVLANFGTVADRWGAYGDAAVPANSNITSEFVVVSVVKSSNWSFFYNSTANGTGALGGNVFTSGLIGNDQYNSAFAGNISYIIFFTRDVGSSIRKRMEQHAAFSFKIKGG